jgi:hypothetical protein
MKANHANLAPIAQSTSALSNGATKRHHVPFSDATKAGVAPSVFAAFGLA